VEKRYELGVIYREIDVDGRGHGSRAPIDYWSEVPPIYFVVDQIKHPRADKKNTTRINFHHFIIGHGCRLQG
jgi:hypothetical protein